MRGEEGAGVARCSIQGQKFLVGDELRPSDAKPEEVETAGAEQFHMRLNALELNPKQQSSVSGYLLYLIYLGLLSGQLGLEVPPDPEKLLGLLPFLGVLVATVLTLTLHDPLC